MKTLLILNDAPYGSERTYNALRLVGSLSRREDTQVKVFLIGDAVTSAKAGQKVPSGYYNVATMVGAILRPRGRWQPHRQQAAVDRRDERFVTPDGALGSRFGGWRHPPQRGITRKCW
jgi:DsrE/DsrF-like family